MWRINKNKADILNKWLFVLSLVLIFVAGSWAIFKPGFFRVHDYTHAGRIAEMARGIQDGQMPVRWSANFGYGQGMPLFVFYAPLPYYAGAGLFNLGLPMEWAVKSLVIIPTIITLMVGYYLARSWLPAWIAVLASAMIVLAPYRAVNFFVRGAFSEGWGMAFFIVSLLGLVWLVRRHHWGWLILTLGLTGMMLSHNLTFMLGAPFIGLFALGLLFWEWRFAEKSLTLAMIKVIITQGLIAGLLALGLSAFYWLPAILLKDYSQLDTYILGDYFQYHLHFLYIRQFFDTTWQFGGSGWGPEDDISFGLGTAQLLGVGLSGLVFVGLIIKIALKKIKKSEIEGFKKNWSVYLILTGLAILALFLTLQRSATVWSWLPILEYAQFPWRFLTIATPFIGLTAVWWHFGFQNFKWQIKKITMAVWLVLFVLALFQAKFFVPEKWLENDSKLYAYSPEHIAVSLSGILADYLPVNVTAPKSETEVVLDDKLISDKLAFRKVLCHEDCEANILEANSFAWIINVNASKPSLLSIHQSYFPGWQAQINGESTQIISGENAQVTVEVPVGNSLVSLWFGRNDVLLIADILTAISIFLFIVYIFYTAVKENHANKNISQKQLEMIDKLKE